MKPEAGKYYLDRRGSVQGPLCFSDNWTDTEFPFYVIQGLNKRSSWAINGSYMNDGTKRAGDLVKEFIG